MPLMASPRPFYPLQQPVAAPLESLAECSAPVLLQPHERMAPASVAGPGARGLALTLRFPTKLRARLQSLRTTSLPGHAKSESFCTAPQPSSTPLPLYAALHDARHCQKVNPQDPLTPVASCFR